MLKCRNCGAEYDNAFLQCPQCGSSKHADAEAPKENTLIGSLVTIIVVVGLLGIIGYGGYLLYHPINEGPTTMEISPDEFDEVTTKSTTTRTTTTGNPTSTTSAIQRTTKAASTEISVGDFKLAIPEGFKSVTGQVQVNGSYQTAACATNNNDINEQYCVGVLEGNISVNSSNIDQANAMLAQQNYGPLQSGRFHGRFLYYSYANKSQINGYFQGTILANKGSRTVVVGFSMPGSSLTEDNTTIITELINSVK